MGLVGESGSGKSTTGRTILGLNKQAKGAIPIDEPLIEKNRQLALYDAANLAKLLLEDASLHEIVEDHFVYYQEEEVATYR